MTKTSDVSLEAVDSNLLPISHKHGDGGAVPLRSESNLDSTRNECYELVNKSDDTKEDQNDAVIENVACHICDINVPKVYFNEHKNGFRHKFNRKVADTALKRLQLYLNKDDINENNEKIPSKHFCTECSIVIHSEDETSHKQTIGHRNSVLLERFLNDFLNYYTNDDYETVDNTKKDVKTKVDEESKNSEINVTINSKKESTKTESAKETKSDENSKRILNSDEQSDNLRPSCELKDGEMMFQIVDSSSISKLKVNEQCYHAIVETGATFEHCMICDQMFVRENRKLHVDSNLHDQKLHQKSLDNNCVRKINSTLHHCILCNDYFTEYDLHVNSKKHLTNFQNQIIYKCKKTAQDNDHCNKDEKSDSSKEYSDDLRSDESKSSTETNKSTAPVNKETSNNLLPSTSSSVATDETAENTEKTVKLNPNLYFCNLCQVEVPRHLKSILEHNNSRSHMLKDKKPIEESAADPADNVSKIDETAENSDETVKLDPYFCNVCQAKVTNNLNSIAEHNRGKSHMLKENKQIEVREVDPADNVSEIDEMSENTEKTVKLVPNLYFCNVCQLEVPRHLNSIVEHNRSRSHMLKVNKQIQVREFGRAEKVREVDKNEETNNSLVPSINSSVDTRPKLFCYTCNVWISKNASKQHNKTMKHTFNSISNYHNLMQYFDEENLFCEICKVTVSSVLEEIKNHFTSSDHIKKYDKLFKAHSITKINNRKHYCAECKVYILHKNNYLHIKSEEHTDKVNFSETDKIDEQSDDITDSIDSDATEATALVDSDSVGSDNTTDNNEVNAANSTTSETGDPLGFDCINSKASLNTFIDKLELELPKHFSQREPSSDREFSSSDNFSKIDESFEDSFEDSEHSERFEKIPNNLNCITEHNKNTSHLLEDNKKFDKGTVDPADNVSKIDETAENSDKTVKLDPNLYFCNVCQVKVPNNLNNIAEHNRGRSHTQKLQNTKVDNGTEVEGI